MTNRLEGERKIQERTEKKLKTMPAYVYDWYINLMASRKTAATCFDFVSKIHAFLEFINEDVEHVKLEDISERNTTEYFLKIQTRNKNGNVVPTSDSYQYTVWSCLNNFFSYLYNRGEIKRNYIKNIDKPHNHDLERINENRVLLTENEFKEILSAVNLEKNPVKRSRNKAIIMLFMTTGMRKTALTNITLDDVDMNENVLTIIDKGSKRHSYSLNEITKNAIAEWLTHRDVYVKRGNDTHLFLSSHGSMLGGQTVSDIVKKYTKTSLGKALSPHKLRSGYCSILYEKTGNIEFVRRAVGHASSNVTQRYIVTKGDERKKASEIIGSIF